MANQETKTVRSRDLKGPAFDWAVALATGEEVELRTGFEIDRNRREVDYPVTVSQERFDEPPFQWSDPYMPQYDWNQGGPLLEDFKICVLSIGKEDGWLAGSSDAIANQSTNSGGAELFRGKSYLEAGLRAIIVSELGESVDIPVKLLRANS